MLVQRAVPGNPKLNGLKSNCLAHVSVFTLSRVL